MKLYFAPMEGITGCIYRRIHHKHYAGICKYFTPFLAPGPQKGLGKKELRDVLPENNEGLFLVPQILTNRSEDFLAAARLLKELGYSEINLNLGCPSGTVTAKKKGSGFLAFPDELDQFLEEIYSGADLEISVKTRIGKDAPEEFEKLLEIYNKYPIKELIIHPRVQADFYGNRPNLEVYGAAREKTRNPLVYNGDLFSVEDIVSHCMRFPGTETLMLGRGLLTDPGLAEKAAPCLTGNGEELDRLEAFASELCSRYEEAFSGDRNALFKMKELWVYLEKRFPGEERLVKKIKKASSLSEYRRIAAELFERGRERQR